MVDWVTDSDDDDGEKFGWDTEECSPNPHISGSSTHVNGKKVDEGNSSGSSLIKHFVDMGFQEEMIAKAIKENGEGDSEAILELLLTYQALDQDPPERKPSPAGCLPSDDDADFDDDEWYNNGVNNEASDSDDDFDDTDFLPEMSEKDNKLVSLVEMGFTTDEASAAIDRCGQDASVSVLADSIYAAQTAQEAGCSFGELPDDETFGSHRYSDFGENKRRKFLEDSHRKRRRYTDRISQDRRRDVTGANDDEAVHLPNPMVGFGLPNAGIRVRNRMLPEQAIGPPYFYYENVALAPRGVWATISRFLYDIEPEFVDSKFFCAANRKRGYVHNLPLENRFPLLPLPPKTISDAFPLTRKWWPSWDPRKQFNCLQTCIGSAKLTERIRGELANSDDPPPPRVQNFVMHECRKWNLVWVGLHKVAPLEPDEVEYLLGFPRNHTRGVSRTERYKSLGNSFQVDTVAYHLSVLKDLFPKGMNVLSLFSGIGGAEVALHRLGIPMKTVVSVEISEVNRTILRSWWEQTSQSGTFIEIADVQKVTDERLQQLISIYGPFDLIIGGSPCNNLTGSNRHHRDGLEGEHSQLFFHYFRILDRVKCIMGRK